MNIQKTTPATSFNGTCIIARAPKKVGNYEDLVVSMKGTFLKTTPREYLDLNSGERINTITKQVLPANPAIDYFLGEDGDVFQNFKNPIKMDNAFDKLIRRTADQIAGRMNVTVNNDNNIAKVIQTLKKNGEISKITIDNAKANRIINELEKVLQEKIEVTPDQPKYFLNCANKMFLIADYTKNDTQNGTIVKYIFDTMA